MQTVINVEQLSKSYGNLLAVDKLSLSVKRGTVYGCSATRFLRNRDKKNEKNNGRCLK